MSLSSKDLTKDITKIDLDDILSSWQWCMKEMKKVVLISAFGDLFLVGKDDAVYWMATDTGSIAKVADNLEQFNKLLNEEENIDNWFLPLLVEKLQTVGKILKENEVYSCIKLPVIGGEYSVGNIEPTDMSVHFSFSGQICEQIKDLPDGTKVNINFLKG